MKNKIIILGGGIAGMSAAHELIERGYQVTVFEKQKHLPGGKARSIPVQGTETEGREPLPGEHGFRFFPGFYKHIIETMERIPFSEGKSVADNLVACPNMMMTRMGKEPIVLPSHLPRSLKSFKNLVELLKKIDTGLTSDETKLIGRKLWQLLTSCKERRINEYERTGWWEFTEADTNSENYRTVFVEGLTRTLVAAKAEKCNTKTNGDILIQMLLSISNPKIDNDRILNGPTNEKWLFPWLNYLRDSGVDYNLDAEVLGFETQDREISAVRILKNGKEETFTADYYICALPVERAAPITNTPALLKLDPNLSFIKQLSPSVAWMNGMQFFLNKDVSIVDGHIILADTPWALTAISQIQFWNIDISAYGDGKVKGIISVDVSNWDKDGVLFNRPAKECNMEEALADVWEQLKRSFNTPAVQLKDEDLVLGYVDEAIIFSETLLNYKTTQKHADDKTAYRPKYGSNKVTSNEEPLLVNEINTWAIRSEARTAIPNLLLASDYVRTFTDLATMEGANEAARRAVNNILVKSGSDKPLCEIWNLHEPAWLFYYKWKDKKRYEKGLPWELKEPWFGPLLNFIFKLINKLKLI